jgi:hypothetical protein
MKPFVTFGFQWRSKARIAVPTAMPLNVECLLGKTNFFSQPKRVIFRLVALLNHA